MEEDKNKTPLKWFRQNTREKTKYNFILTKQFSQINEF